MYVHIVRMVACGCPKSGVCRKRSIQQIKNTVRVHSLPMKPSIEHTHPMIDLLKVSSFSFSSSSSSSLASQSLPKG